MTRKQLEALALRLIREAEECNRVAVRPDVSPARKTLELTCGTIFVGLAKAFADAAEVE